MKYAIYKDVFNGKAKALLTRIYLHGKLNLNFSISGEDCIVYEKEQDAKDIAELIEMETSEKLKVTSI